MRILGRDILKKSFSSGGRVNILQTHAHWDHMMGFPFFSPAYMKNFDVNIHHIHPDMKKYFEDQMDRIHFPVSMDDLGAKIEFHRKMTGEKFNIGCFDITSIGLHHPGGSYAYRINSGGKTVVFATDGEYTNISKENYAEYIDFYRGADVLIFDAMYSSLEKTIEKENFGHSTAVIGINIALDAGVKTLILFHHDPESNDVQILEAFNNAEKYLADKKKSFPRNLLNLLVSYDNLSYEL
jgi:phosphoribosyl 1,2-cyclic phosphodiesterase